MKLSERAIFISFYEEMDVLCQRVLHEMNVEIPTFQISKNEKMEDVKDRLEARLNAGVSLVICRGLVGAMYLKRESRFKEVVNRANNKKLSNRCAICLDCGLARVLKHPG